MEPVEKTILRKMLMSEIIGGRHTAIEHLKHGFPTDQRGEVEKAAKRLIRQGYILMKQTSYGLHVSLNPHMIPEIERILGIGEEVG